MTERVIAKAAPVVSVVIPAYNRAYIIAEAVNSALGQTFGNIEVLVIDDGSEDDTPEVISKFRDSRIRYIRHESNRGCSAAYNTGLREARGEFISFLDSDDLWKAGKTEREMEFFRSHPEADAVFVDLEKQDGQLFVPSFMRTTPYFSRMLAERSYPKEFVFSGREIYLCLLREVPIKIPGLTFRSQAAKVIGLMDEQWPSGADWEYLLRFAKQFRFGYIDEALAIIRVQPDAVHRQHVVADKSLTLLMLKQEITEANGDHNLVRAAKWGYCDIAKRLAWQYLDFGEKATAARVFARAFRETGNIGMLQRALMAFLPVNIRRTAKRALGRKGA